jgi:hypothetical protein
MVCKIKSHSTLYDISFVILKVFLIPWVILLYPIMVRCCTPPPPQEKEQNLKPVKLMSYLFTYISIGCYEVYITLISDNFPRSLFHLTRLQVLSIKLIVDYSPVNLFHFHSFKILSYFPVNCYYIYLQIKCHFMIHYLIEAVFNLQKLKIKTI